MISYGYLNNQFTYVLVLDTALARWGKIRVNHIDIGLLPDELLDTFDLTYEDLSGSYEDYDLAYEDLVQAYGDIAPIRSRIVFLQNTGALRLLVSDPAVDAATGLAIFGHVQVTRAKMITFQSAKFDGLYGYPAPRLRLLGSLPGNGYDRNKIVEATLKSSTDRMVSYAGRSTFENFDVAISGKFAVTAAVVETTLNGSR